MSNETILVTGSMGCIGSWVLRQLVDEGTKVIASDLSKDTSRPKLLFTDEEMARINWLTLDVTDKAAVNQAVADNAVTHIVHLAGLQVPFVKANPSLGAAVNVVGTVNILEAARNNNVKGLSYASSMAVFGPPDMYPPQPLSDAAPRAPDTLYGVYKVANEETARIYWQDWQIGSVGLRPGFVFGLGRDQGLTSDIAKAILAVAANRPFHIRFDGPMALQHASDVAAMFVGCARAGHQGATACNLRNDLTEVVDFVGMLKEMYPHAQITFEPQSAIPIASDVDDSGLQAILGKVPHIPLRDAIMADVKSYTALIAQKRIDLSQLER